MNNQSYCIIFLKSVYVRYMNFSTKNSRLRKIAKSGVKNTQIKWRIPVTLYG